jgi:type II secretory pathway predicted ATPase ExeA
MRRKKLFMAASLTLSPLWNANSLGAWVRAALLRWAGADNEALFADEAITAIHQGSGGLLRRAKNLARGAMLAAAAEQAPVVTAEHIRLASTEIL